MSRRKLIPIALGASFLVQSRLQGLVISVVSLRRAKAVLRERGLLGSVTGREATIDPSKIHGLSIRLVEGG